MAGEICRDGLKWLEHAAIHGATVPRVESSIGDDTRHWDRHASVSAAIGQRPTQHPDRRARPGLRHRGWWIVAVGNDRHIAALCRVVGPDALATNRTSPPIPPMADRDRLAAPVLAGWTWAALAGALAGAGVPIDPINDMADYLADPRVIHRGVRIAPGGIHGIADPMRLSDAATALDAASPALDADRPAIRACGFAAGPPGPQGAV